MHTEKELVYDDDTRKEPTVISLHEIDHVKMTSLKAFEISQGSKTFCFEASDSLTQKQWVEALKFAIQKAKSPPLAERVMVERRQRLDLKKREAYEQQRYDAMSQTRHARDNQAKNTKVKYGLSPKY